FVYAEAPRLIVSVDPKDRSSKILNLFIPLANTGSTATQDLEFLVRCVPSDERLPEPWDLLLQGEVQKTPQLIPPRQTVQTHCACSLDHIRQIKEGNGHGYVMGQITYKDRLAQRSHLTQFNWELFVAAIAEPPPGSPGEPNISVAFTPVGRHNC